MTDNTPTTELARRRHAPPRHRATHSSRWRAVAITVAFALMLGMWLGGSGTTGRVPRSTVSMKLLGATDTTPPTTTPGDPTTSTTTPSTTVDPPAPAPAGYAAQLDALYGQIYATSTALPNAAANAQVETPAAFDAQVQSANAANLAYVYNALPSSTVTSLSTALQQVVPVQSQLTQGLSVHQSRHGAPTLSIAHLPSRLSPHDIAPQHSTIIPLNMPTNDPYTGDVSGNTYTASCPPGAPAINASDVYGEGDLFAIHIAIDVVSGAYNGLSPGAGTDSPVGIGFFVAAAVLAVINLALQVTVDTLGYFQTVANDCLSAQIAQVGIDTNNNTFQTYTLLSNVAGTVNEIDQNLANLTNQDTNQFQQQLSIDIQQALTAPLTTTPLSSFELPVSYEGITLGGYLNSTPVGVNEVVANAIQNMQTTGQTMSPQATRYLSLAQQAMAAAQFKLAFDYFRLSYQAAAG